VQFLPALCFLTVLGARGDSTFTHHGAGHASLLAACGLVTALPLVFFGMSATRLPLSTIGLMQYLAPVFQFVIGLVHFHEKMPAERWAGFLLVWVALVLLSADALRTARRGRRAVVEAAAAAAAARPAPERPEAAAGA
jgi:chloramphenicol-sensitive protein RarD